MEELAWGLGFSSISCRIFVLGFGIIRFSSRPRLSDSYGQQSHGLEVKSMAWHGER